MGRAAISGLSIWRRRASLHRTHISRPHALAAFLLFLTLLPFLGREILCDLSKSAQQDPLVVRKIGPVDQTLLASSDLDSIGQVCTGLGENMSQRGLARGLQAGAREFLTSAILDVDHHDLVQIPTPLSDQPSPLFLILLASLSPTLALARRPRLVPFPLSHSDQQQVVQQEQLDRLFRLVRRRVEFDKVGRFADQVAPWDVGEELLRARDLGPEGLNLSFVEVF